MDFSSLHFSKPLAELTYADISGFFSKGRTESATLEFKSFPERSHFDQGLQKVARGISSFLNSTGGILIWGAPKGAPQNETANDIFMGQLCPVKDYVTKDTLINRINALISPLAPGLEVQILSDANGYIYVFEVQESSIKPHQFDYRYYIRLDGQTHPAPHYLVDAMIKKISYPDIAGVIKFHELQKTSNNQQETVMAIEIGVFNFSPFQNEESVSFRLTCSGGFFTRSRGFLVNAMKNPSYTNGGKGLSYEDFANVLHYGTPRTYVDEISFSDQTLKENGGVLNLHLSFGGKRSPAKLSSYAFDLSKYWIEMDPNDALIRCEENQLIADTSNTGGMSREKDLRAFTAR